MLVLAGDKLNLLSRGTVTMTDEDATFGKAGLYDKRSGLIAKFLTNGANRAVTVDGDLALATGNFDTAHVSSAPPGWTAASTGTGALVRDTGTMQAGASSCRMDSGAAGRGIVQKDFTVRAGEELTIEFYLRGDGTNAATCDVQNLETGKYLTSGAAWQVASTTIASRTTATFAQTSLKFTMEAMSVWPKPTVTLRVRFLSAAAAGSQAWVDECYFWPSFDFLSVHGHNIRPHIAVEWRSSTDNFSGSNTLEQTMTLQKDAFYGKLAAKVARRYVRLLLSGTNMETPWLGELVIGQQASFTTTPATPVPTTYVAPQISGTLIGGGSYAYGLAQSPIKRKLLTFRHTDISTTVESGAWRQFFDELFRRSIDGTPFVIVPTELLTEVMLCRLPDSVSETHGAPGDIGYRVQDALPIEELPLPMVTA